MSPDGGIINTPYRLIDDENQTRADTIELLFLRKLDTPAKLHPVSRRDKPPVVVLCRMVAVAIRTGTEACPYNTFMRLFPARS